MTFARAIRCAGLALLAAAVTVPAAAPAQAPTGSATLSASLGMRIDGRLWRQHAGVFVAGAGDVNGDGLADVLIGTAESHRIGPGLPAPNWNLYVVFGRRGARGRVVRLDRLAAGGLHLLRHQGGFSAGAGVADVNGDGHRDVVVGSPYLGGREGGAFVVTRARRRGATIDTRAPENGWYRIAGAGGSAAGWSVASAGDQNRDGLNDLLIGSLPGRPFLASSSGPSSAYVVYGSRAARDVGLATLGAAGAVLLDEAGGDRAGQSVAGLGDVNGDGARDIAVAAPRTDFVREQSGSVYVIYGRERTMPHGGVKKGVGGGRSERGLARRR